MSLSVAVILGIILVYLVKHQGLKAPHAVLAVAFGVMVSNDQIGEFIRQGISAVMNMLDGL